MSGDEHVPSWVIDPHIPSVARMYDYYLGGKDNFAVDRAAADQVVAAMPSVLAFTRANRRFLSRAVTLMAQAGVRQFLDIGSGLPTRENVHEVAQRTTPEARVVYVDNDPIVLSHGRALLASNQHTTVVQADLHDPKGILEHPDVRAHIDFTEPVALLLLAILHFIPDEANPGAIVAELRDRLVPGSYLAISHGHAGKITKEVENRVRGAYKSTAARDLIPRTPEEVLAYFEGMEVLEPGIVPVEAWRPESGSVEIDMTKPGFLGVVGVRR